jgi:uncharacterized protein
MRRLAGELSKSNLALRARRCADYAARPDVSSLAVIAHGGEPTLLGPERLDDFFGALRAAVASTDAHLSLALQTNGTRVDGALCDVLRRHSVGVGVSLDGPPEVNDRYRLDKGGRPTTDRVLAGAFQLAEAEVLEGFWLSPTPTSTLRACSGSSWTWGRPPLTS